MSDDQLRNLTGATASAGPVRRGRSIIAVIGIDSYTSWPQLHNAVGDAQGVRSLFVDRLDFKELMPPLLNEQASHDAIVALVQDQLRGLLEPDDSLVLFFAGHGHTETAQVGTKAVRTGYLIPVDGRAPGERKFSSYLKLDSLLEDVAQLPARHILVILDSCHSGFALNEMAKVQILRGFDRYTDDLSARMSRRVITSALHDQAALDSGPVAGHSLFTGTLIEALDKGEADADRKGFVTSSELALYVQKSVASWSNSQQTPDFGAFELDERGELVVSLRGETRDRLRAKECQRAADAIYKLGWITADRRRFMSAARHYREALKYAGLGKLALPEAELGLGQALFAAGPADEAAQVLGELVHHNGASAPAETLLYLGMVQAKRRMYQEAASLLATWQGCHPDHADAAWVGAYVDWLHRAAGQSAGGKRALLIGIDEYSLPGVMQRGCVNDAERLMKPALMRCFGLQEQDITTLVNRQATRAACVAELERLAQTTTPADSVLVHFSGHAVPARGPNAFGPNDVEQVYLVTHDTNTTQGFLSNGIRADELHRLLQAIPATHKTLVLDTRANTELIELARREGSYALILASDTAQISYEWQMKIEEDLCNCGMLTAALCQALIRAHAQPMTYDTWVTPAIAIVEQVTADRQIFNEQQTPLFVGLKELSVFGDDDCYLPAFEFAQRRQWPELTHDLLVKRYAFFRHAIAAAHPRAHAAYGRALLASGACAEAITAFETAREQIQHADRDVLLNLARAQIAALRYADARATFQRYLDAAPAEEQPALAQPLDQLTCCVDGRQQAVLVGINHYGKREVPGLRGAHNDVAALRRVLIDRWGFLPEDVVVLEDAAATRDALLRAFQRLVVASRTRVALFHFSGYGSCDQDQLPAIVSYDGRSTGVPDITLDELAALVDGDAANLYVALDADLFGGSTEERRRALPPAAPQAATPARFATDADRCTYIGKLRLGTISIVQRIKNENANEEPLMTLSFSQSDSHSAAIEHAQAAALPGDTEQQPAGTLSAAIVTALSQADPGVKTVALPNAKSGMLPIAVGREQTVALPGDTKKHSYGTLSAAMIAALAEATPGATTVDGFAQRLRQALDVEVRAAPDALIQPLFVNTAHTQVLDWLVDQTERRQLQAIVDDLTEVVALRAEREEYWPEGLLNLGIAEAARGDYQAAREKLEEAVALFSGDEPHRQAMAMRA